MYQLQKNLLLLRIPAIILVFYSVFFGGCNNSQKEETNNFVKMYAELRLATVGNRDNPARGTETRRLILAKYNSNLHDFEQQVNLLRQNKENWVDFQMEVIRYLEEVQTTHKGE